MRLGATWSLAMEGNRFWRPPFGRFRSAARFLRASPSSAHRRVHSARSRDDHDPNSSTGSRWKKAESSSYSSGCLCLSACGRSKNSSVMTAKNSAGLVAP